MAGDSAAGHEEKAVIIAEIVALEGDCAALREMLAQKKAGKKRSVVRTRKALGLVILGRRLTVSLGDFLATVRNSPRDVMGPELARTLDALSLRMIGRKRWITLLAMFAAIPGVISLWLGFQQNHLTDQERL